MNDDLFLEGADDAEASDGLIEDYKDFLRSLEKKAAEIESEVGNPD